MTTRCETYLNGASGVCVGGGGSVVVVDRSTGASMMEQLVPEITTHALSYLDYPSLCRLSMTNSAMRKAANDDNAWKALYHKVLCISRVSENYCLIREVYVYRGRLLLYIFCILKIQFKFDDLI